MKFLWQLQLDPLVIYLVWQLVSLYLRLSLKRLQVRIDANGIDLEYGSFRPVMSFDNQIYV